MDGIYYKITNSTTREVSVTLKYYSSGGRYESATIVSDYQGDVVIPSSVVYNGTTYFVTGIDNYAFDDSDVTSVSIPNTVKSIGSSAFAYCPSLSLVTVSNTLTTIGSSAFNGCSSLQNISLPQSLTSIGSSAFRECASLTTISIPGSVSYIGPGAFYGSGINNPIIFKNQFVYLPSSYQGSYEIPKGITEIIGSAFADCTGLTEIFIPNEVTTIGESAFRGCSKIKYVIVPKGVQYIPAIMFYQCTDLEEVSLPNTITGIGKWAFGYSGIKTMIIPPLVTSINDDVFYGCRSLQSVTFPANCYNCRLWAFGNTPSLSEIFDFADSQQGHSEGPVWGGASRGTVHVLPGKSSNYQNFPNSGWQPVEDLVSITSLSMSQTSYLMIEGSQHQLQTTIFPANSSVQSLYWYSSNTDILTVSSTGVVTAKARGTATITAETRDGSNLSASCTITVKTLTFDMDDRTTTSFSNDNAADYNQITYTRNFTNTKWQSLYVPFTMTYEDWKEDFDVAYINSVRQYDNDGDGAVDETIMDVIQILGGELYPNMPYLIRAKSMGEKTITLNDATLYKTEENSIECSTMLSTFTFTGTYETIPAATLQANGYYAMGGGGLIMTNGASSLKPFRWYLDITSRSPMYNTAVHNPSRIGIHVIGEEDGMETRIYEVAREEELDAQIFNLNGQKMGSMENLAPGVYVKNGKKFIIK